MVTKCCNEIQNEGKCLPGYNSCKYVEFVPSIVVLRLSGHRIGGRNRRRSWVGHFLLRIKGEVRGKGSNFNKT